MLSSVTQTSSYMQCHWSSCSWKPTELATFQPTFKLLFSKEISHAQKSPSIPAFHFTNLITTIYPLMVDAFVSSTCVKHYWCISRTMNKERTKIVVEKYLQLLLIYQILVINFVLFYLVGMYFIYFKVIRNVCLNKRLSFL